MNLVALSVRLCRCAPLTHTHTNTYGCVNYTYTLKKLSRATILIIDLFCTNIFWNVFFLLQCSICKFCLKEYNRNPIKVALNLFEHILIHNCVCVYIHAHKSANTFFVVNVKTRHEKVKIPIGLFSTCVLVFLSSDMSLINKEMNHFISISLVDRRHLAMIFSVRHCLRSVWRRSEEGGEMLSAALNSPPLPFHTQSQYMYTLQLI